MTIKIITPPTHEPITLLEAREHLRVEDLQENAVVHSAVKDAREFVEGEIRQFIMTQIVAVHLDCFVEGETRLGVTPIQSINKVEYIDAEGTWQTLDTSEYRPNPLTLGGSISPGTTWPTTQTTPNAIKVTVTAGYGDTPESVPNRLRRAVKLMTQHFFDVREAAAYGVAVNRIPFSVDALLAHFKAPLL